MATLKVFENNRVSSYHFFNETSILVFNFVVMGSFFGGNNDQSEISARACISFIILALALNILFSSLEMIIRIYRKIKSILVKKHDSRITNYKISENPNVSRDFKTTENFK